MVGNDNVAKEFEVSDLGSGGGHTPRQMPQQAQMTLSVVIPSYNSAPWLTSTLQALSRASSSSSLSLDVIVVDDGSSDNTIEVIEDVAHLFSGGLRVVRQPNKGRFLARWAGLKVSTAEWVLFLDSRVLLEESSLSNLKKLLNQSGDLIVNGYVETDPSSPLVGFFWEVPTHIFWRRFFSRPRRVSFGLEEFDRYPKGTGCLVARREDLVQGFLEVWPESNAEFVSDDTRLLRTMVSSGTEITIDPGFRAIYRPRVTFDSFIRHSFLRGTLFVDSYFGTGAARSAAIVLIALAPLWLVSLTALFAQVNSLTRIVLIVALLLLIVLPALVARAFNASNRALHSYFLFVVPFVIVFSAGLVRGLWFRAKGRSVRE